ncbi:MAG: FixH family protein, partial [Candidatus Woesearchaeota archaeon]|nr:FixH family protein [Candidatus Woesearchaeota archaeon]
MNYSRIALIGIAVIFLFFFVKNSYTSSNSGIAWTTQPDTALTISFTTTRCPAAIGVQTITATIYGTTSGNLISNADVNATAQYPNAATADINFSNNGNGTYSNDFNFSQTGTYQFDINATRASTTSASRREYVYVQSFNINSIFLNNNASLATGTTGTIRNQVTNDDGNAFVDINGLTTIYYPNGTTFASNGSMTDLGTGEYVYAFTVPAT